jgi:hypothetical protein
MDTVLIDDAYLLTMTQTAQSVHNILRLDNDDPEVVGVILRHLYDYGYDKTLDDDLHRSPEFHLRVFRFGQQYAIKSLMLPAAGRFSTAIKNNGYWQTNAFAAVTKQAYSVTSNRNGPPPRRHRGRPPHTWESSI